MQTQITITQYHVVFVVSCVNGPSTFGSLQMTIDHGVAHCVKNFRTPHFSHCLVSHSLYEYLLAKSPFLGGFPVTVELKK